MLLAVVSGWLPASGALAQAWLDTSFDPLADRPEGLRVQSHAVQRDGKIIIGGYFDPANSIRVIRLNADGSRDPTFQPVVTDGDPTQILIQPDGKILIGSLDLYSVNGHDVQWLARLNPDGSFDDTFVLTSFDEGSYIRGLALQADGKILIAGRIFGVGGTSNYCLARLNGDGSVDPSFVSPFRAAPFCPEAVALTADGKILAAGSFPFPTDDDPRSTLVRLNADGSLDANLTASTTTGDVRVLYPLPDGRIVAAGAETGFGQRIFRLNADGTRDPGFDVRVTTASGGTSLVSGLFVQPNGKVVATGPFALANGEPRSGFLRINADGSLDQTMVLAPSGVDCCVSVASAQVDGRILVVGTFTTMEGAIRPGIARLLAPEPATQSLTLNAARDRAIWQRDGSGMDVVRARFEVSSDGQTWSGLGAGVWNAGAWTVSGLSLPTQTSLWLRASGYAVSGAARNPALVGGPLISQTRQVIATVTPSADSGGAIAPAVAQFVDVGGSTSFTITAQPGRQLLFVDGSCGGALSGNVFTTAALAADCTVIARFADATALVVTPSAGPGGAITPAVPQAVQAGATPAFTITPSPGYRIDTVAGSCGGVLSGNTYTTAPVTAHCTVQASFLPLTYTVTAAVAGSHGSITPATQTVAHGATATISVMPEPGYNAVVTGCGGVLSGQSYTTSPVTQNCAVSASFTPYTSAGASMELKVSRVSSTPCDDGAASIEIEAGEPVVLCALLHNQTGRTLDSMTVLRSGLAQDFNAIEPIRLSYGSLNSGSTTSVFSNHLLPRQSGNIEVTWSALDTSAAPRYFYDDAAPFVPYNLATSTTATRLALDQPRTNAGVRLPFPMLFFGIPTDTICVGNDGVIIVGVETCNTWGEIFALKLAPALRTAGDYLTGYAGGAVYTDVIGSAPNRRFIVEWRDKEIIGYGSAGTTFQVLIDESTNVITYQYVSMVVGHSAVDNGNGAFAGLHLGAGMPQLRYPSGAVLTNGKAIRWAPQAQPFTIQASASVQVTVRKPVIRVPAGLGATAEAGKSTTAALTLGNDGNVALDWTVAAPGAAAPQGAATVPGYAHAWENTQNSRLVSLDAAAPTTLTRTNESSVGISGDFVGSLVDNDARNYYLLGSPGVSDDASWDGWLQRSDPATAGSNRTLLRGVAAVPGPGQFWRGMRWDLSSNTLFAVASNYGTYVPAPYWTDLYTLDPASGRVSFVARLDDLGAYGTVLADIAIDNHGNVYGIDMGTDTLVVIDKVSGHIRTIGPTGLKVGYYNLQSMDFDHATGVLYYATWTEDSTVGAQMFTIDTSTGAASLVGRIGDGRSGLRGLSIATPGGPCVDAAQVPWLSLDRASGTIDAGETTQITATFDATGLASGTHHAQVCVGSNTPYAGQVVVPVTFTVGDALFSDGFESN